TDTKKVFEAALKEFGDVDILINNAAIGEQKMIDETSDEWMHEVINVNLAGPMRYIREALKIFLPKNEGVIINISSVNGTRPFCGASYTATKGAINTLTKNVAMRLSQTNIRCNAVAPGSTITPMHLANQKGEQPGGKSMLEFSKHYVYFPGPECDPIDQAYACLYLASKMGKAVKGQVIQVCNGAFL
ncbi:Dehydrogenase with different specificity (related to short-chain alcohol dehydrogenases), partial [Snodgrassella alvi SCGC AB-598-O02]